MSLPKTAQCTHSAPSLVKLLPNNFWISTSSGSFWVTLREELISDKLTPLLPESLKIASSWVSKSSSVSVKLLPKEREETPLKSSKDSLTLSETEWPIGTTLFWLTNQSGPSALAKPPPPNKSMKSTPGSELTLRASMNKPPTAESFTEAVLLKRTATNWSKSRTLTASWSVEPHSSQPSFRLLKVQNSNTSNDWL